MSNFLDPTKYLPVEISLKILSYMKIQELRNCCSVSKEWNRIASDDALWKRFFYNTSVPLKINVKKILDRCAIKSKDEILGRIKNFIERAPLNQKCNITFLFPFNPGCAIRVELKPKKMVRLMPQVIELYIFMKTIPDISHSIQELSGIEETYVDHKSIVRYLIKLPKATDENIHLANHIKAALAAKLRSVGENGLISWPY